ncbi:MAG: hypothetical protein HY056_02035 [Proteobacteria bacterium]|nr:hypothetical protein [Pseudomonadota bacterium]
MRNLVLCHGVGRRGFAACLVIAATIVAIPADAARAAMMDAAALPATSVPLDAAAATDLSAQRRQRRARRRIEIYPQRDYVRRCVDWYAVERRASGPTVVPHMRCWWARR